MTNTHCISVHMLNIEPQLSSH